MVYDTAAAFNVRGIRFREQTALSA